MSAMHVLDRAQLDALSRRPGSSRAAVLLAIDHFEVLPARHRVVLLDEARGWLADCGLAAGTREGVDEVLVRELVDRHYDGGWSGFVVNNAVLLDEDPADRGGDR